MYWVKISYYDDEPEIHDFQSMSEAEESFCEALSMAQDRVLGDVARIGLWRRLPDGSDKRLSCRNYD